MLAKKSKFSVTVLKPKKKETKELKIHARKDVFRKDSRGSYVFKQGHPKLPGAGRAKGTPNKITRTVKEAIIAAFEELGAEDFLIQMAKKDRRTFAGLLGKIIPLQVEGKIKSGSVKVNVLFRDPKEDD